jgi:lactam utilization protein B
MANFELKFIDVNDNTFIEANVHEDENIISIYMDDPSAKLHNGVCVHLDKSTAIKFAKTLRTEINKIKED